MSDPSRLRFRLVDEFGIVHIDEEVVASDVVEEVAEEHGGLAQELTARGLRWEMQVSDPDDIVPSFTFHGGPV